MPTDEAVRHGIDILIGMLIWAVVGGLILNLIIIYFEKRSEEKANRRSKIKRWSKPIVIDSNFKEEDDIANPAFEVSKEFTDELRRLGYDSLADKFKPRNNKEK